MPAEDSGAAYEIAHVLFVDIIGYSLQPIDRQTELLTLLQKIVRESAEFRRARDQNELISLPTGDGMGLVFLRDPLSPVKCAIEIANSQQRNRTLSLRMGIHTGPVKRHADIREDVNVVGGGINIAQRVMDCGDAGHILLSRNVAEVLEQFSDWRECLQDLGVHEVKHGVKIHLYGLVKAPVGNPELPRKLILEASNAAARGNLSARSAGEMPLGRRVILFATAFLVACVLSFGFEQWLERGIESGESAGIAQAAFTFSGVYQKIVAASRIPIPRYTAVVEIDPERDPGSVSMLELCRQRQMMAVLIRRIAAAMPSVIVVDKFFGESACPGDINPVLIAALTEVNAKIPVVVGRRVSVGEGPYLEPSPLSGLGLRDAIVNIDPDTRKLPLKWQVFRSKDDKDHERATISRETLALTAAQAYAKGKLELEHPQLAKLLDPVRDPYISFLNPDQFKPYRWLAGFVLCGREVKPGEDATACPGSPGELAALSGKIVVIGEIGRDLDMKSTVVGTIPGVYLQANFIEALLDDRYYEDAPVLSYVFAFLFLAAIEAILMVVRKSRAKRLGAIAIVVLAMLFLLYIAISDFHWYVNPVPFIALALLIRALAAKLPYFRARA
ncbi:MAG TPA: CHASE2 domain-containing protein [Bryobacteraceae bacterium]|jgi:CHASE2 domain-containing sensor protein/class 3 adenylate cyclase|nr:CHASE2 domain-containing protein [Bryobacteraceae bacterium]